VRRDVKRSSVESIPSNGADLGRIFRGGAGAVAAALLLFVLAPAAALGAAPVVTATTVSEVTTSSATLEADVNPGSEETSFHFEYGLADCASSPCATVPVPDGNVGSGSGPVRIFREAVGLAPDTTYHFRVVATNGSGTTNGPDRTFTTYAPPSDAACANQAFRVGSSSTLPDCRAYEMVSPVDKNNGDIKTICNINCNRTELNQASVTGDQITYSSYKAFGDSQGSFYSNQYIATRTPAGWLTHGISPRRQGKIFNQDFSVFWDTDLNWQAFTPDLAHAALADASDPPLTPEAVDGYGNLYARDNTADALRAMTTQVPTAVGSQGPPANNGLPMVEGVAEDGSHWAFTAQAAMSPEATGSYFHVYDFSNGGLKLASVMPDGSENPQAAYVGGPPFGPVFTPRSLENAVSADGSRIFWTVSNTVFSGQPGAVYVRIDGETTVAVSASVPGGNQASFQLANRDGSVAFFTVPQAPEAQLYEFDVDANTATPIAGGVEVVFGASDDGSTIYFVSKEALAAGATAGQPNVYLRQGGTFTHVATLAPQDVGEGELPRGPYGEARVSPDGGALAFVSHESLTGYDNADAVNGQPAAEVFVYRRDSDQLLCASCNPSGARPVSKPMPLAYRNDGRVIQTLDNKKEWAAAWLTSKRHSFERERIGVPPRTLSDDGNRVFFNAFDALVPADANGAQDVYQWEANGTGSCTKPAGCISLISSGQSPKESEFVDASPDGRDVFFTTDSSLLPQDPALIDIYDARVGGGFPPPPPPPSPCVGDACQGASNPPPSVTPGSATFQGPGDPTPRKARRRCPKVNKSASQRVKKAQRKRAQRCRRAKRRAAR
jgi:hypothetical protein